MRLNVLFVLIFSLAIGCTTATKPPIAVETPRQTAVPLVVEESNIASLPLRAKATVAELYRITDRKMVWVDTFGLTLNADSLMHFIKQSPRHGLSVDDYHFEELRQLTQGSFNHENASKIDVLLTDAYFSLWYHLKNGRVEPKSFTRIALDSIVLTGAIHDLEQSLIAKTVVTPLEERAPKFSIYTKLQNTLAATVIQNTGDTLLLKRRDQLIANMERWRWEKSPPDRYISVNVPAFMLRVIENDSVVMESRVIIGKPETPTPNIKSVVNSFIIYPYWHVPRSILKEILPSVQADTNYLRKHNYQVIDSKGKVIKNSTIDFNKYSSENFPYVLRQREGSENTMGVIKFVFPNNYGVYLHDTNARRLFSKADRALSHGCIRVQKAVDLAKYLAKDDDTYVDAADLEQYLMVRKRLEVKVVKPIPVHLDYFTIEQKGDSIVFFDDLYKKDKAMIDSINRVKLPGESIVQF